MIDKKSILKITIFTLNSKTPIPEKINCCTNFL